MKSHFPQLAAMAMLAGQGLSGYPASAVPERKKAVPRKYEQKKCKSCALFYPMTYRGSCPHRRIVGPLECACQNYEPKKKR